MGDDGLALALFLHQGGLEPTAGFEEIRKASEYHGTMQVLTASR